MTKTQVDVISSLTSFRKGDQLVFQLHVVPKRTMTYDEFIEEGGRRTNTDKYRFRYAWEMGWLTIIDNYAKGIGTNANAVHAGLKITGSASAANATPDPKVNKLLPNLQAKGLLADAVLALEAINVTEAVEAILYTIEETGAGDANLLTTPGASIVAAGRNILTESTRDTGVYLMDATGAIVATATISRTDSDTVEFSFDTLPADGEYTLTLLTRNGMDATKYGPTVCRRNVTVKTE